MSVESLVQHLRGTAERVLIDSAAVTRGDATPVLNPTTGQLEYDPATAVWSGACFVPPVSTQSRDVLIGESADALSRIRVLLDYEATGIKKGDVLTLSACHHDPELVGRSLSVMSVARDSVNVVQVVEAEDLS